MTMAKRKLSTGGNIYFTLDNYGRKKANLFFPGGDIDIADDGGGIDDIGGDVEGDTTDPELNFGQKLKKFGQENGDLITDTLGGLGLGIGYASQRRYNRNRKHNLLKAAGVTNYRGKYTFGNGGNLYGLGGEKGKKIAGGIAQGLESAGSIAALTAQNASIADTSELEGAIQDKANVQVTAGSNDDLMSEWASRGPELKHVSWKDVRGQSAGKSFGNIMSAGAAGAKAGMKAGPIGAVAGAVGGIFSSTIGAIVGRRKAKKKAKKLNAAIDAANERNLASFEQRAENIGDNQRYGMEHAYYALGGPLGYGGLTGLYNYVGGPLEAAFMYDHLHNQELKAQNAGESNSSGLTFGKGGGIHINPKNKGKLTATSKRTGKSFSELAHSKNPLTRKRAIFALNARKWHHGKKHAFGGDLESNGANWDLGFTSIGNGGTHEMNPYEGVQMGMDSKGIPNLVEQNEVIYNKKALGGATDSYVFSDRLPDYDIMDKKEVKNLLDAFLLPSKYKGLTFAEMAKRISGEIKERPNDPISLIGYKDTMDKLLQAQEWLRNQENQRNLYQRGIWQRAQQQAQQQAYQNALAQQAYNNQQLGAMQGMVSPEEPQQFAKGGFKARRQARLDAIEEAKANGTYVSSREKWNAPAWQTESDEYQQESYGMQGMRQRMANRKQARLDRMEARGKKGSDRYNRVYNTLHDTLALLNQTSKSKEEPWAWEDSRYNVYRDKDNNKDLTFEDFYNDYQDEHNREIKTGRESGFLNYLRTIVPSPLGLTFLSPEWWDELNAIHGIPRREEAQWPPKYGCGGKMKFARGGNLYGVGSWLKDMFGKTPSVKTYYPSYFGDENSWNELVPGFTDEEQAVEGFENPWTDEALKNFDFNTARMYMDAYQNGDAAMKKAAQEWINKNMKGMTMDQYNQLAALNPQTKMPVMPTTGRNAPIYGDVAAGLINGIWGNKQDYANKIQAAADAARVPERVGWNPVGNYLQFRPIDTQATRSQLNSLASATNRAIINGSNGNRATSLSHLLASQYDKEKQMGLFGIQAAQYNDAQRKAVEEFNRATNLANSEGFLKADMANQAERRAGLNSALQGTVYAQNMANDNYYNWLSNMNKGIGNLMGDISSKAKENMAYNMLNFGKWNNYGLNPATGETIYLTGLPTTKTAARGGYLTMPDRQMRRRKR